MPPVPATPTTGTEKKAGPLGIEKVRFSAGF